MGRWKAGRLGLTVFPHLESTGRLPGVFEQKPGVIEFVFREGHSDRSVGDGLAGGGVGGRVEAKSPVS